MKDQILELATELIARPSITPDDAGCQEVIGRRLEALGFHIEVLKYSDVTNLWARLGDTRPLFVFAGHTDVVPTGSLAYWDRNPFEPTQDQGKLWGRGAADMKTSLAAMVVATEKFLESKPSLGGSIGFLITSDEEGIAVDGTRRVVDHLAKEHTSIDCAIVGEPSSSARIGDVVRVGRRGSLNGSMKVVGALGHVAYANVTPNPIHAIAEAFAPIVNRTWDHGNEYFTPTTFQISNIQSGTGAENVIPGELELKFNFRYNTEQTAEKLQREVTNALNLDQRLELRLDWRESGKPFLSKQGALTDAVTDAIQDVMGFSTEKSTSGGTSDARFLVPAGAEVVELGPVNKTIHKINEHVSIDELEPLGRIYVRVLETMLA